MRSPYVLHACGQDNPRVHALLVHGDAGRRKAWLGERTDRNGNVLLRPSQAPKNRGAAVRAEMKRGGSAFVADADERSRCAADRDGGSRKASLGCKNATSTALASEAMADGDAQRLLIDRRTKLTA